jgi:hypothetical protein
MYDILECDVRPTALGEALYVRLHRKDMALMGFRELWEVLNRLYPGKWAIQSFPLQGDLLDQANKYHFFVYDAPPSGVNLAEDPPKGTRWVIKQLEG